VAPQDNQSGNALPQSTPKLITVNS